jgi:hypothetical protein
MKTGFTQNSGKTANLRPFKKGRSGNPGGRPKTAKLAELIREYLEESSGGKTRLLKILEMLAKRKPEVLLHYAYGKPIDVVHFPEAHEDVETEELAIEIARHLAREGSQSQHTASTPLANEACVISRED